MDKVLSKSRSRFFGKKKSTKNLGISSSDLPGKEAEGKNEIFGGSSPHATPPTATPKMFPGGASVMMIGGSRPPRVGSSDVVPECPPILHSPDNPISNSTHSHTNASSSQSRFEVHISPTAFSPIIIPSSASPDSKSLSPTNHRQSPVPGLKEYVTNTERTPRVGDGPAHTRSQSVVPEQNLNSRLKSRRHGIPAGFLETIGATSGEMNHRWNGQSLGAEHFINTNAVHDRSMSSFPSRPPLVRPSASAPVTSCLSNAVTGLVPQGLSPIHESSTVPSMLSSSRGSSAHSPLPRSSPSYNLAALTPSTSAVAPTRTTEISSRSVATSNHGALPQPPVSDAPPRPYRGLPSPPHHSSPPSRAEISAASRQYYSTRSGVSSETEIGYKGLAFPLPPSSEEGLAISYSSSQSSLISVTSGRGDGNQPTTPGSRVGMFRSRNEPDVNISKSTESHGGGAGSERSTRDRNASDGRASPIPDIGAPQKRRNDTSELFSRNSAHAGVRDIDRQRDTLINVQERVAKELEDALDAHTNQERVSEAHRDARVRTASEASRHHPAGARPQTQPAKQSEPTKPLVLNSARKTLHTMRSFTSGFGERKQIHASLSNRDLSTSFNSVNGRGERVRTMTAIPVRPASQRDREVQSAVSATPAESSDTQPPIPPSFPLPTPPNSSSALALLADETKSAESTSSRRPAERLAVNQASRLTLEDVTNALRTQRVRFDELAGHVLEVAQRHTAEKDACLERVGRLEGEVAKMEREIRGLRWLVLEHAKGRLTTGAGAGGNVTLGTIGEEGGDGKDDGQKDEGLKAGRTLRRSSTMPQLPTLSPHEREKLPQSQARSKRFGLGGLGLDFSPDSVASSLSMRSPQPPDQTSFLRHTRAQVDVGERTPSMDEIIDKLMAVRQWAGADVRVSVVENMGAEAREGGGSKRIVFKEPGN